MSCQCDVVFLREPVQMDLEAMGNQLLTLSINLWTDRLHTIPYDLSGYTARGALRRQADLTDVHNLTSATITNNATICNITGLYAKASVESLLISTPYYYDISVDNSGTGDSFCVWTGIIIFQQGAST